MPIYMCTFYITLYATFVTFFSSLSNLISFLFFLSRVLLHCDAGISPMVINKVLSYLKEEWGKVGDCCWRMWKLRREMKTCSWTVWAEYGWNEVLHWPLSLLQTMWVSSTLAFHEVELFSENGNHSHMSNGTVFPFRDELLITHNQCHGHACKYTFPKELVVVDGHKGQQPV